MADQLYLSLWFPNFRLVALPDALTSVMRQFARLSGPENQRVSAATVYPISFSEAPIYQRIFVNDERAAEGRDTEAAIIENTVAEATEQLHDDLAYEFEMRWNLWTPDTPENIDPEVQLDTLWRREARPVRILGFGPQFDAGSFEQNGHIRIDFGLDTPWVLDALEDERMDEDEGEELEHDEETAQRIQQNIETLLAFTLSVEKHCGISSRLLWTESGEPLAEKLIARLQRLN